MPSGDNHGAQAPMKRKGPDDFGEIIDSVKSTHGYPASLRKERLRQPLYNCLGVSDSIEPAMLRKERLRQPLYNWLSVFDGI